MPKKPITKLYVKDTAGDTWTYETTNDEQIGYGITETGHLKIATTDGVVKAYHAAGEWRVVWVEV